MGGISRQNDAPLQLLISAALVAYIHERKEVPLARDGKPDIIFIVL